VFCEVIELRKNGLRLRPEEWPAPVVGQLRMAQWDSSHTNYHRTIRKLVLWMPWGTSMVPGPSLADAQLVDVVGDAQLIRGDVLQSVDGRIHEHAQLWLLRARQDMTGAPLPPFDVRPWTSRLPSS
jgi:hypothetical protein